MLCSLLFLFAALSGSPAAADTGWTESLPPEDSGLPSADQDGDGLSDEEELTLGTDPLACDSDEDGLVDALELGRTEGEGPCFTPDADPSTVTDPLSIDTDLGGLSDGEEDWDRDGAVGSWETDPADPSDDLDENLDGIPDAVEARCELEGSTEDADGDGLSNQLEGRADPDGDGDPNFCDEDSDGDQLPDEVEGQDDVDDDGIPNWLDEDSDGDGLPDEEELLSDRDCDDIWDAYDPLNRDGPCGDSDGDGLTNEEEQECGSDPFSVDSDGDGRRDGHGKGEEDCEGDYDCDGLPDILDDDPEDGPCSSPPDDPGSSTEEPEEEQDWVATFTGGSFAGGSCSSLPLSASLPWLSLLAAALLLRRRREGLMLLSLIALGLSPPAAAQEAAQVLQAESLKPSLGSQSLLSTQAPATDPRWSWGWSSLLSMAREPLQYRYDDSSREAFPIVDQLWSLQSSAWWQLPGVRAGLILPVHGVWAYGVDQPLRLGDLLLQLDSQALVRGAWSLGGGLWGQLPTGDESAWVGEAQTRYGAELQASWSQEAVLVAADLGWSQGGTQRFQELSWGPRVDGGVGLSWPWSSALQQTLELDGGFLLGNSSESPRLLLEGLGSLQWQQESWTLGVGAGAGLSPAMTVPRWRGLAQVGYRPSP